MMADQLMNKAGNSIFPFGAKPRQVNLTGEHRQRWIF
jgi:hypothetical protein